MSGIVVVVETIRGDVTDLTYSMLAAGRVLADGLGESLTALLVGHNIKSLAGSLGAADKVACVDQPELADFNPEAHLQIIAGALGSGPPRIALFAHSTTGTDLACGVGVQMNVPVVTCCQKFAVDGSSAAYSSLTCGGKIVATGPVPEPTCVATVMAGGYKPEQGKVAGTPMVEDVSPLPPLNGLRTSFERYIEPEAGDVDIAKEPVLVSVGRGIQSPENLEAIEGLAAALGGVVSGSRPVVDQGWLPTSRLVGKSGKAVKPRLYLALGISGAPEHAEGMRDANFVVAINTDEKAPIFDFAKYGSTVDLLDLVPRLTEKVKQAKGG